MYTDLKLTTYNPKVHNFYDYKIAYGYKTRSWNENIIQYILKIVFNGQSIGEVLLNGIVSQHYLDNSSTS